MVPLNEICGKCVHLILLQQYSVLKYLLSFFYCTDFCGIRVSFGNFTISTKPKTWFHLCDKTFFSLKVKLHKSLKGLFVFSAVLIQYLWAVILWQLRQCLWTLIFCQCWWIQKKAKTNQKCHWMNPWTLNKRQSLLTHKTFVWGFTCKLA